MDHSYSIEQIKAADAAAIGRGVSSLELMERAGGKLADRVSEIMKERGFSDVLFVCGGGNNGGDGFFAAQKLFSAGRDVAVLCLAKKCSHDCAHMMKAYEGELFSRIPRRRFAFIVDCIFGTGLRAAPEGDSKALIGFIGSCGAYVLSCDLPSGLGENGVALDPCVRAAETLCIGGLKSALLLADGADCAGKITVAEIGLEMSGGAEIWQEADVSRFFPKRSSHSHKEGAAAIIGGGGSAGAGLLASSACLKSGAGYTKLFLPAGLCREVFWSIVAQNPALILRELPSSEELLGAGSIAFGMGAGVSEEVYSLTVGLLQNYRGTLILDADALNSAARFGKGVLANKECKVIITPHPGEFARLCGLTKEEVLADFVGLAERFAREFGVTVLLKNNRSVITDGERTAINLTGTPALAKGGSGDVLSGLIAGACARGLAPYEAACTSAYLLGKAGELAAEEMGEYAPDATDVIRFLPRAIRSVAGKI